MCDDGCSDCKKPGNNVVKDKMYQNVSNISDDEKILEVFGKEILLCIEVI